MRRWSGGALAGAGASLVGLVALVAMGTTASCAGEGRGTGADAERPERVTRSSAALSTCVRQLEPIYGPAEVAPASPSGWFVLKTDGSVWAIPTLADGRFASVPVAPVGELRANVRALADASGDASTYCAIKDDGALFCWGANVCGAVGNGAASGVATPTEIAGPDGALSRAVASVATGRAVTCAVTTSGDLYCWGQNDRGQLGLGFTTPGAPPAGCVAVPQRVAGPADVLARAVKQVAVGADHVCAVTTRGALHCWGGNAYGQTGRAAEPATLAPAEVSGFPAAAAVLAVSAGAEQTCAIVGDAAGATAGSVYCFGRNRAEAAEGALGVSLTEADRGTPERLAWLGGDVARVDVGVRAACAVRVDGSLACWGWNDAYQLGDGTTANRAPGVTPGGLTSGVGRVAVGYRATCALRVTSAYCWGAAVFPDGTAPAASDPARPPAATQRPSLMDFCDRSGADVGADAGAACETSAGCGGATPICQAGRCRGCLSDGECAGDTPACARSGACVECTERNKARCVGAASACDPETARCTEVCATDRACGDATSGKVCDAETSRCKDGCRGEDGNGCPGDLVCSSATAEIGICAATSSAGEERPSAPKPPYRFESVCAVAPRAPGVSRDPRDVGDSGRIALAMVAVTCASIASRRSRPRARSLPG